VVGILAVFTDEKSNLITAEQLSDIEIINRELEKAFADSEGVIKEMCAYLLAAGGKRIRPLLVLYGGLAFSGPKNDLLEAAIAMELVHMASLIHDDVIDQSGYRRNRPSINMIWGNQAAVLCGDYLFAQAFKVLAQNNLIRNLNLTVKAIQEMCRGEIIQAEARFNMGIGIENYYERITKKTAILLQCSCQSGAIIGGASETQIEEIGRFGLYLGLAFQIVDDILDFSGDSQVMGKPKHEDITQGNLTLPALLLLDHPQYGGWFRDFISRRQFQIEELERVDKILAETGIIQKSFSIAISYIEIAKQNLRDLPSNSICYFLMETADKLKIRAQ
jgi:Geranylgeranyl pyrophosphate synthase